MFNKLIETLRIIVLCVVSAALTGCASLLGSPMHTVLVQSDPANASYTITTETGEEVASGTTPDSVLLRTSAGIFQKSRYFVTVDLPGHKSQTNTLNAKVSGWYWLNLVANVPGFMGLAIIDPFTGAMFKLPDESSALLEATP